MFRFVTIGAMGHEKAEDDRELRKFKGETVFGWDEEPVSERPSEQPGPSLASTWAIPNASMPATIPMPLEVARPRPPHKRGSRGGARRTTVLFALLVAVAFGAGMHWMRDARAALAVQVRR